MQYFFRALFSSKSIIRFLCNNVNIFVQTQHDLENYILLGDLITVIIGYIEIDKFKNEKQYRYYNVMQVVSNMQYNLNQKVQQQKKNKLFICIDLFCYAQKTTQFWSSVKTSNQNQQ